MGDAADLQALADAAATRHGLDPALFRAVIQTESSWNPKAVSPVGAQGLGQLEPGTAQGLGVSDPFDPQQNLDASARYLRGFIDRYGDENTALAAYNAGPGAVTRYGGIPPFRETQKYIQRVQSLRGGPGDAGAVSFYLPGERRGQSVSAGRPDGEVTFYLPGEREAAPASIAGLQRESRANLTGLHPDVQNALSSAAADLRKQGIDLGPLITSGFRSYEDQARLYAQKQAGLNPNPVARPGTSLHERGDAVDIALRHLPPEQQQAALSTLQKYGLARPMPASDPVHFQLQAAKGPAAPMVSSGPVSFYLPGEKRG